MNSPAKIWQLEKMEQVVAFLKPTRKQIANFPSDSILSQSNPYCTAVSQKDLKQPIQELEGLSF